MTDEERQRTMGFIVQTLARLSVNDEKHDHRLDRLERIAGLMAKAGLRARKQMREWEQRHRELLASQAHTDRRLDALIDVVREQRNGHSS